MNKMSNGTDKRAQKYVEGHRCNPRLYWWINRQENERLGPFADTEVAQGKKPDGPGWTLEGKDQP